MTRWKNRKNGKYYALLAIGSDHTNSRAGVPVVVYCPEDNPHMICVREYDQFVEKFVEVSPVRPGDEPWNQTEKEN